MLLKSPALCFEHQTLDSISESIRRCARIYSESEKNLGIEILALGGAANQVHMLTAVAAKRPLSDLIRDLKANSWRWMAENSHAFSKRSASARGKLGRLKLIDAAMRHVDMTHVMS
jgi:REP element-mobilizing transposase RayT